jgi:hypothetical protein
MFVEADRVIGRVHRPAHDVAALLIGFGQR